MASNPCIALWQARQTSDPVTTLQQIATAASELNITLSDCYGDFNESSESSSLRAFEVEVAQYTGKENGLFLPSGTMAQNMLLGICREKTGSNYFGCHFSSHILLHEQQGYHHVLGMVPVIIPPDLSSITQQPITYDSFMTYIAQASTKPAVMIIECPHREVGGKCTSFEDLLRISDYCHTHGIHLHMDGARLWEATAAYACSVKSLCALFDTLYVSFYKGLGGITGAMLLGTETFTLSSRVWLRRYGGNVYSLLPYYVSSWHGFRANRDHFLLRTATFQSVVHQLTEQVLSQPVNTRKSDGGPLLWCDPASPTVSLMHVYFATSLETAMAINLTVKETLNIQCFNRFRKVVIAEECVAEKHALTDCVMTEFNMGPTNMLVPVETWVAGWRAFVEGLRDADEAAKQ